MTDLVHVDEYQSLFREVASLEIARSDVRHLLNVVSQKLYDLLIAGQSAADQEGRDLIHVSDLPLTLGLRDQINDFSFIDVDLDLNPIFERVDASQGLTFEYADDLQEALPELTAGLIVAVARSMRAMNPKLENPDAADWDQVKDLLDNLL